MTNELGLFASSFGLISFSSNWRFSLGIEHFLVRVAPFLPRLARPGMRVYAEAEHRLDALGEWRTVKRGQAGQVFYHLLER